MANLTIRNIEDDVVERLKEKARQNGRSLEAEIRAVLRDESRRLTGREARAIAEHIAGMAPKGVKQTDSTEIIRKFRDSR
jgi:plasmid stability protein